MIIHELTQQPLLPVEPLLLRILLVMLLLERIIGMTTPHSGDIRSVGEELVDWLSPHVPIWVHQSTPQLELRGRLLAHSYRALGEALLALAESPFGAGLKEFEHSTVHPPQTPLIYLLICLGLGLIKFIEILRAEEGSIQGHVAVHAAWAGEEGALLGVLGGEAAGEVDDVAAVVGAAAGVLVLDWDLTVTVVLAGGQRAD